MQARFVEVVDVIEVAAEAGGTFARLLSRAHELFDISSVISNSTYSVRDAFAQYNYTPTFPTLPDLDQHGITTPQGHARHLLLLSAALLFARELFVAFATRRLLRKFGHHVGGRSFAVNHER